MAFIWIESSVLNFSWGAIKLAGAVAAALTALAGVLPFFFARHDDKPVITQTGPHSAVIMGSANVTNNYVFQPNTCASADGWKLCVYPVKDKSGVTGNLITVISNDINWKLGSHEEFEHNGLKSDLRAHIRSPGISTPLKKFKAIIAVGAASHEVTVGPDPIKIENDRAYKRAMKIQFDIKENIVTDAALYVLSLGRNKNIVTESASQRLIVILGIADQGAGFDIESALRGELRKVEAFPFDPDQYSDFLFRPTRG